MGSYQDIRNALPAASQVATVTEDFFFAGHGQKQAWRTQKLLLRRARVRTGEGRSGEGTRRGQLRETDSLFPSYLVHVLPALEQCLANAVHAGLDAVVRVLDVGQHLLRAATVRGREGLVPLGEDVTLGIWGSVLGGFAGKCGEGQRR